jgi:hypothetical protein
MNKGLAQLANSLYFIGGDEAQTPDPNTSCKKVITFLSHSNKKRLAH